MKLSILICSLESRRNQLDDLIQNVIIHAHNAGWKHGKDFELIIRTDDGKEKVGTKRNELLKSATGDYIEFLDDDDAITIDHFPVIKKGIEENADCISLRGIMTVDGENPEIFEHSIKYKEWKTNDGAKPGDVKYERMPNHLNCIKRDIAVEIAFPEIDFSEDHAWSKALLASGLIKTEYYHEKVIYLYQYKSKN